MKPNISQPPLPSSYFMAVLLIVITIPTAVAQTDNSSATDAGLELNGLIIDETVTKLGNDFYELFYNRWQAPKSTSSYTLYIREQMQPGRGTRISVLLNDNEIMSQVLQPREEMLLAMANRAVQLVRYQILHYQQMVQQLENEDQYGSGIF